MIEEAREKITRKHGFTIVGEDLSRPWGGFFIIDERQAEQFARKFFAPETAEGLRLAGKLSPKILLVKPGQRLSWQYHHRRAEIWRVVAGSAGVVRSKTDQEGAVEVLAEGDLVRLEQGERHRLVGLADWAVIAEIWQHTDPAHPSDESDIVRLQDDYGR